MKQKLLLKTMLLLFALIAGSSSVWAATATLTNAQIVAAGSGDSGYKAWAIAGGGGTWNAYAIKNQHSNATSSYHFLQIKKYASNTAYYIQVPELGTKITSITMTVSGSSQPMTGGSNSVALYFSASNSTSATGTGVASGTGTSSVTIDCSSLNLNTGYITAGGAVRIWDVTVTYTEGSTPQVATPTFSPAAGVYTSAQNVEISTTTESATIYYTTDGTDPTTSSDVYSSAISVSTTTTIKAMAVRAGYDNSVVATANYKIVTIEHAGTQADPYTVADARNAIDANTGIENVYVTGIVCEGGSYLNSGKMNYYISDDGTETDKLEAYKGKNLGNTDFTATTDVIVGDRVTIYGTLKKHNSTYEFDEGNYITALAHDTSKGSFYNPYTVAEVIDGTATGNNIYVRGFIVGEYVGNSSNPRTSGFTGNSNLAVADAFSLSPVVGDCIPVELPSSPSSIRTNWGLQNNPSKIGYQILFKGNVTSYFSVSGIKGTSEVTAISVPLNPAKTYTTLTAASALDFSGLSLEAYIVKDNDTSDGYVTMTRVNKVPANTGLVLKASSTGSPIDVPVLTGDADDVTGNLMAGSATATTAVAANAGYILSNGVFQPSSGGDLPAGKAYLNIAVSSAPVLNLNFGDDTTGIDMVKGEGFKVNGEFYNLNGQRVAQPTKGLYIVNGKKVVIK